MRWDCVAVRRLPKLERDHEAYFPPPQLILLYPKLLSRLAHISIQMRSMP